MITELHLKNVGPASEFDLEFGERLNIFTGDNGLGKTFLLDIIWWVFTRTWADNPAFPYQKQGEKPEINYRFIGDDFLGGEKGLTETKRVGFSFKSQRWVRDEEEGMLSFGLIVYIRVDGSFSVWDPVRNLLDSTPIFSKPYHFTPDSLWNGLEEGDKILCNGLIRDWITWQYHPKQAPTSPFNLLSKVLKRLSPLHSEQLKPGEPKRISLEDVRDIPTIDLPYGTIPITRVAAGMKRILGLAYLLVWTWYEHTQAANLLSQEPTNRLILLMDEVEAHLHPQWQRSLLTSLLTVAECLKQQMHSQVIVTTHSPLVMASVEPLFDEKQDKLFLFELKKQNVTLHDVRWAKQGDAVGWLTSDIFGLQQARSREAEHAIDAAYAFMRNDNMRSYPEHLRTKELIHQELLRVLAADDPFWVRWIVETNGKKA